jgi:hypothetical protein
MYCLTVDYCVCVSGIERKRKRERTSKLFKANREREKQTNLVPHKFYYVRHCFTIEMDFGFDWF